MATTQIDLHRQGQAATLTDAEVSGSAAISISKLSKTVIAADGSNAFTSDQSHGTHKITNLGDPGSAQDAATKNYVDNVAQGLKPKPSAIAATTGAESFTIASGNVTQIAGTTVDGVSPAVGDYILVKDAPASTGAGSVSSDLPGNGLYKVTSNSTNLALTRAVEMDDANDPPSGAYVFIEAGSVNASSGFVISDPASSAVFTYGSGNIKWVQFTGAGEISAGSGLQKSGNTISIEGASNILLPVHGGTGVASPTAHGVLIAEGSSAQTSLVGSTAGQFLRAAGSSADPAFANIPVHSSVSVTGAVNSSNTSYTLGQTPNPAGSEQVFLNGLLLNPGAGNDYTISGTTVTMLSAPVTGDTLRTYCSYSSTF